MSPAILPFVPVRPADDLDSLVLKLQSGGVSFISPQVVSVSGEAWSRGLMVKDPDGHAVLLVQ